MKTVKLFVACLVLCSLVAQESDAQRFKLPFGKKADAPQQQQSENLTQSSGPWLIMCASFVGEDGRQQARRLAQELRERHDLNAYVYSHEFDFGADAANRGIGFSEQEVGEYEMPKPIKMKTATVSRFEETAVLVGDFATVDDDRAQRTLKGIKALSPESLANDDGDAKESSAGAGMMLAGKWTELSRGGNANAAGPMRAAFMMPNPLLPDSYFAAREIDPEVIKWNMDAKYSLVKNPSMYTIKIATFSGDSTFQLDQIQKTQEEDAWRKKNRKGITESKRVNAEKKATILADHLRKEGVEAYEFHDRFESYVCVGGYDWLVQEDDRGVKQNHPGMVETIKKFKGQTTTIGNRQNAIRSYPLPDKLAKAGIACDMQPIPVLVPKAPERSASRLFSRR